MLKPSIERLSRHENLDSHTCQQVIDELLQADTNPLQTAAFLVLLRAKKETPEELAAMTQALQQKMLAVTTPHKVLDIVGTGGDGANTLNISTGSAILAASCGVKIAKHGNRAVSSLAGSADVLEALGVAIDATPKKISASIDEIGIGFCFSPHFHPAMRKLRMVRQELNIPTTFNLLAPLLNPTKPAHFILGVFDETLLLLLANLLKELGTIRSVVVHGCSLDEISCVGITKVIEISPAGLLESTIDPEKLGLPLCRMKDLQGGDAVMNAELLLGVFSGKKGPIADTLTLNAAVAMWLYGLYPSINMGLSHAKEKLADGSALKLLQKWIEFSHD